LLPALTPNPMSAALRASSPGEHQQTHHELDNGGRTVALGAGGGGAHFGRTPAEYLALSCMLSGSPMTIRRMPSTVEE